VVLELVRQRRQTGALPPPAAALAAAVGPHKLLRVCNKKRAAVRRQHSALGAAAVMGGLNGRAARAVCRFAARKLVAFALSN